MKTSYIGWLLIALGVLGLSIHILPFIRSIGFLMNEMGSANLSDYISSILNSFIAVLFDVAEIIIGIVQIRKEKKTNSRENLGEN